MVQTPTIQFSSLNGTVAFAGLTGTGLYQINVTIPSGVADGEVVVVATAAGVTAPYAVITVKQ
jgi:uncharacterized protein (TIGR03437 family)